MKENAEVHYTFHGTTGIANSALQMMSFLWRGNTKEIMNLKRKTRYCYTIQNFCRTRNIAYREVLGEVRNLPEVLYLQIQVGQV